ncbi:hypothetical protein BP5796_05466 [Coleophoma crateriformis]|uniref:Uncharacterized protein n=1 Tax=Coleophoma crateriformis TaxID=565419 RepID=A0A3D8S3B7_9HELO|nr:hypothetical protein BP5796_05466 [Coleophoma crateriformis]
MNLKPTEDYKTIALSGLTPSVIVECASRALGFWTYQATQEMFASSPLAFLIDTDPGHRVYQGYLSRNLTEKYGTLHAQMEKVINDADAEVVDMALETENLRHQNENISQALREKSRAFLQLQELYDKQKGQERVDQVQHAASTAVEQTIQASGVANSFVDRMRYQNNVPRPASPPLFSAPSFHNKERNPNLPEPNSHNRHQAWAEYASHGSIAQERQPPFNRPQRFPGIGEPNQQMRPPPPRMNDSAGPSYLGNRATPRQTPLRSISSNSINGLSGYGMSAGLKVSNPTSAAQSGYRPISKPRVVLRPPTGFTKTRPPFGPVAASTNTIPYGNGYE